MEGTCKICNFVLVGDVTTDLKRTFNCRRYPPQLVVAGAQIMSMYPPVQEGQTCGEFEFQPLRLEH